MGGPGCEGSSRSLCAIVTHAPAPGPQPCQYGRHPVTYISLTGLASARQGEKCPTNPLGTGPAGPRTGSQTLPALTTPPTANPATANPATASPATARPATAKPATAR